MEIYRKTLGEAQKRSDYVRSALHALDNPNLTSNRKRYIERTLLELGYGDEPNIYQGAEKQ